MGIPAYFKYITDNYPEVIVNSLDKNNKRLFLDLNCAIHKCCRKVLNQETNKQIKEEVLETKMMKEIIDYINYILKISNPKLLFIAIDGVAPRAKMSQQRLRRFKSVQEKQKIKEIYEKYNENYQENILWDTNKITPGTVFMHNLSKYIIENLKNDKIKIILSDSNQQGEGEHKIIEYIKNNTGNYTDIIYGLDADLIMLSMQFNNIYLLRESLEFGNKIETDEQGNVIFLYLSIDELKENLYEFFIEKGLQIQNVNNKNNLFKDYIFLCFLLGNDFLPHIESLNIKEGGIDKLIEHYVELFNKTKQNIIIIENEENVINLPILKIILKKLQETEDEDLRKITDKNLKMRIYFNNCSTEIEKELEKFNKYPIMNNSIVKKISMGYPGWKDRYYKEVFNIEQEDSIQKICINYFEGLYWNMKYYFENCKSWSWYYKYSNSPTLNDLHNYLDVNINKILKIDNKRFTPYEQLLIVLPPQSNKILPDKISKYMTNYDSPIIEYYPINYKLETLNKMFYWQCHPLLPRIDDSKIKKIIENTDFSEEEKKRNQLSNYYEIN